MLARVDRGLRAVAQAQAAEHIRDMVFDRPFADHKLRGDFAVGCALGNQAQHLDFARSQFRRLDLSSARGRVG